MSTRQLTEAVRSWPCCHVDTLDGPVHLYAYTSPSGVVVYTYQRPGCVESYFAYGSQEDAVAAVTFWERMKQVGVA